MFSSPKLDGSLTWRLVARLLAALTLAIVIAVALSAFVPGADAQERRLTVASSTTYRVDIDNQQVLVEGLYQLRNEIEPTDLGEGRTQRVYFTRYDVVTPPSAFGFTAEIQGRPLETKTVDKGSYLLIEVRLPDNLDFGEVGLVDIAYTIPNSGPRAQGWNAQISRDFVELAVWAQGSPGAANVRVILPSRFDVDLVGDLDAFVETVRGDQRYLDAAGLTQPREFRGQILARRDVEHEVTQLTVASGTAAVLSRPSDTVWRDFVVRSLQDDLPVLEDMIGIPWPTNHITVEQSEEPHVHGFGGWYDTDDSTVEVGEDLDQAILLHEFGHAWFNQNFTGERWITEGLAEEFASRVIEANGGQRPDPTWPDPADASRLPLENWQHRGTAGWSADHAGRYHYDASWWVFRQISDEIGIDTLSDVLVAFDKAERSIGQDDWRVLFDLVDAYADDEKLDALFETYVLPPTSRLQQRRAIFARYDEVFGDSNVQAPAGVEEYIAGWYFEEAELHLKLIEAVLPRLRALEARAVDSSIDVSDHWRWFESAQERSDLGELDQTITDDFEAMDMLDVRRGVVLAAGAALGISVDFEPMALGEAERDLEKLDTAIDQIETDRADLAKAAADAGIAMAFEPDLSPTAAERELDGLRLQLERFVHRRQAIEDRAAKVGLTTPIAPSDQRIETASQALDRQAATLDELVAAEAAIADLSRTEQVGLLGHDVGAALLDARAMYEVGAFDDAAAQATAVNLAAIDAADRGQHRFLLFAVFVVGLVLALVVTLVVRHRRGAAPMH